MLRSKNRMNDRDMFPESQSASQASHSKMMPPDEIFLGIKDIKSFKGGMGSSVQIGSGGKPWYDRKLGAGHVSQGHGLLSETYKGLKKDVKKVIPKVKKALPKIKKAIGVAAKLSSPLPLVREVIESRVKHDDNSLLPHERLKYSLMKRKSKKHKLGNILRGLEI